MKRRVAPWLDENVMKTGLLLALIPILYFRSIGGVGNWKYTHFLFNYEDEFVKRGFVGEVLRLVFESTTYEVVTAVSYTFLALLIGLLFFLFVRPYLENRQHQGAFLFSLIAVTSPATLQHFLLDVGRLDIFILVVTISSLFAIRLFHRSAVATCLAVSALLFISVLIHEASIFLSIPLVLAYWVFKDASRKAVILQSTTFLGLFLATYLVSRHGLVTLYDLEQHLRMLRSEYGNLVVANSLNVVHYGSVSENLARTLGVALSRHYAVHHGLMFAMLAPLLFILVQTIRACLRPGNLGVALLIVAAFSPLALYPLGHDHFRWWAIVLTNLFIALALLAVDRTALSSRIFDTFARYRYLGYLAVILAFVTGPLGVMDSFRFALYN